MDTAQAMATSDSDQLEPERQCAPKQEHGTPPSTPPGDPQWDQRLGAASGCDLPAESDGFADDSEGETIILLDWDDTLLPSTMLTSLGYRVDGTTPLPSELAADLSGLEEDVIRLLDTCLQHGTVLLVTNAETGWVELSSARFMPSVIEAIRDKDIKIVSARSCYDGPFPNSPVDWKQTAFVSQVGMLCEKTDAVNLVSIGDSLNERTAAHHVGGQYESGTIKTVKFVERPDIDQIRRQLALVASNLGDIAMHDGSFDVNLVC